ncbi:hypothetical protein A9993_08730 [Rahnella victoriana]|nr:hypothetical protein A9993_08730 [Rahnella victoriana]
MIFGGSYRFEPYRIFPNKLQMRIWPVLGLKLTDMTIPLFVFTNAEQLPPLRRGGLGWGIKVKIHKLKCALTGY